jgi:N utilization substance protein B
MVDNPDQKPKGKIKRKRAPYRPPEKPAVKMNTGSKLARRTGARLAGVQIIYQMLITGQSDAAAELKDYLEHRAGFNLDGDVFVPPDADYLAAIVMGLDERRGDITEIVTAVLAHDSREGIDPLLKAILYAGTTELLLKPEVDTAIIIADYLSVTKGFYDDGEAKLIHALLDKIAQKLRA